MLTYSFADIDAIRDRLVSARRTIAMIGYAAALTEKGFVATLCHYAIMKGHRL
jgi:hypothetical protein